MLGRTPPATVLDLEDSTLSRRHLSFSLEAGRLLLRDLGSRNGTLVKVDKRWGARGRRHPVARQPGASRRRSADGQPAAPRVVQGTVAPAAASGPPPPERAAAPVTASAAGDPTVSFGPGKVFPFGKSPTLLDLALAKRVRIKYECKVGDCGKCRVEVTSGDEHLTPRTPQEDKALRMIGHDEPSSRLACLVKEVRGPLSVQIPK